MPTPQSYLHALCWRLLWALQQLYFQSSLCYCANVSIASQCSQPIPKLHQTHPFIPWIIWQQFSSKEVLSSSFPSIILPPVVFMYPAFILFHLLSFTTVSSCRHGDHNCFSNFSPYFPLKSSAITDSPTASCSGKIQPTNNHLVPAKVSPRSSILPSTIAYWTELTPLGLPPFP